MSIFIKKCNPGNKRYGLYFKSWWNKNITTEKEYLYWRLHSSVLVKDSVEESYEYFDLFSEVEDAIILYNDVYQSTPQPTVIEEYKDKYGDYIPRHYLFEGDSKFWGYAILDFQECKILKIYGDLKNNYPWNLKNKKSYDYLELLDRLFRRPNEIPENYKWDGNEEYLGWLQFRWGNGLNAISRKEVMPPKKLSSSKERIQIIPPLDDDLSKIEDKFSKDIEKEKMVRKQNHW